MDFIRKEDGNAAKATTWVCTAAPGLALPYYQEALDDAIKRGVSIALHLESRSLLVRFPEPLLAINVRVRLESILKKGRAATKCVDTVKVFDFFHAESWGMLAVNMPDLSKSELFDELVEEESSEEEPMQDADSEDDAPEEPAEGEAQTDIIILTHQTQEKNVNAAMASIENLSTVSGKIIRLRLEHLS